MPNANNTLWTPELIERLRHLWPDHSASQVSAIFAAEGHSISRSAVIGKSQRLELSAKLFTKVSAEEQRRKKLVREARYGAAASLGNKQAAIVLRTKGALSQSRARLLEPISKSELYAMLAQAVRNTQALQAA